MKKYNKGFTLIELLVVIAIIGILASIVLVSLNTARNKGKDSSATGSMSSVRNAAEIYFDNVPNSYAGLCGDAAITRLLQAASDQTAGGTLTVAADATTSGTIDCSSGLAGFAASVELLSDTTHEFCVDSNGTAGKVLLVNVTTDFLCN